MLWCRREEANDLVEAMKAACQQLRCRHGQRAVVDEKRINVDSALVALALLTGNGQIVVEGTMLLDIEDGAAWGPKHTTPRRDA